MKTAYFWFRRDLRLDDNTALFHALKENASVQCLFIFDTDILDELPKDDARVSFIHSELEKIHQQLQKFGSSLQLEIGRPAEVWKKILSEKTVSAIYTNKDYEPYARKRDGEIRDLAEAKSIEFKRFKDQVIYEENDVLKKDGKPYTIYTPFKNLWRTQFVGNEHMPHSIENLTENFAKSSFSFPSLDEIGMKKSSIEVKPFSLDDLAEYPKMRDLPAEDKTSYLSPHLRFGTIGIRTLVQTVMHHETFLNELIWREFFMQILYHFPKVVDHCFKAKYEVIPWRNNEEEFEKWCKGETGYPMVDAGMRQLNETGYMHNRVRMVVASFLCKHLLIDWRWGEAYFAEKLLDYDLSANNGNWQWAAGTGCDSAPYFRVFNPTAQLEKFDKKVVYVRAWVKDLDELTYPQPMVDHKMARERAISTYKEALANS
ncbi:MAG: deoxyribodipyrimidine photo-lyase [Crocinitomicaceae bacterium]|nr:deoxyribodipyrimidine photo-lyase [Crocinitomicaceae bacterium]